MYSYFVILLCKVLINGAYLHSLWKAQALLDVGPVRTCVYARVRYQEKLTLLGFSVSEDPYEHWNKEKFVESMSLWPPVSTAIFSAISWSDPAVAGINQSIKTLQDRALKTFTKRR